MIQTIKTPILYTDINHSGAIKKLDLFFFACHFRRSIIAKLLVLRFFRAVVFDINILNHNFVESATEKMRLYPC